MAPPVMFVDIYHSNHSELGVMFTNERSRTGAPPCRTTQFHTISGGGDFGPYPYHAENGDMTKNDRLACKIPSCSCKFEVETHRIECSIVFQYLPLGKEVFCVITDVFKAIDGAGVYSIHILLDVW